MHECPHNWSFHGFHVYFIPSMEYSFFIFLIITLIISGNFGERQNYPLNDFVRLFFATTTYFG